MRSKIPFSFLIFFLCFANPLIAQDSEYEHPDFEPAFAKSQEMQSLSQADRGRALLKYLYRDYLKKYSLNQTRLDTALQTGSYNCVSSAVLVLYEKWNIA